MEGASEGSLEGSENVSKGRGREESGGGTEDEEEGRRGRRKIGRGREGREKKGRNEREEGGRKIGVGQPSENKLSLSSSMRGLAVISWVTDTQWIRKSEGPGDAVELFGVLCRCVDQCVLQAPRSALAQDRPKQRDLHLGCLNEGG